MDSKQICIHRRWETVAQRADEVGNLEARCAGHPLWLTGWRNMRRVQRSRHPVVEIISESGSSRGFGGQLPINVYRELSL